MSSDNAGTSRGVHIGSLLGKRRLHISRVVAAVLTASGIWAASTSWLSLTTDKAGLAYAAIVLLVVGLLTGIIATKLDKLEHGLLRGIGLAQGFTAVGLTELYQDSNTFDYSGLIINSQRLVILLNDGRTWTSVHRDRLRKRLADPNKETVIMLIHPESPMIAVLARKGGSDADTIRTRIAETVTILCELRGPSSSLEVLGHFLFNPASMVLGDDAVIVCPYFASRGGRTVPALKFTDVGEDCYFRHVQDDLKRLRIDAASIALPRSGSSGSDIQEGMRLIRNAGPQTRG